MHQHGQVFGVEQSSVDLVFVKEQIDARGFKHVTFQQYHHQVPIYDGKLRFHYDDKNVLRAINGNYLPHVKIDPKPTVSLAQAGKIALEEVERQFAPTTNVIASQITLYVFRTGLAQGVPGENVLAYEVEVGNGSDIREFVFVNAHNGTIVDQISGTHQVLFRRLYEEDTSDEIWTEGDTLPGSLDQWQVNEVEAAGHTYHFFFHAFGIDSYDNNSAEMWTINNDPNVSCPNAQWSGGFTRYCTGTASDDVVAHEWGHAYTDFSSNLIYQWQAGAINESLSDIWGETIDLINAYEDVGEDLSLRTGCGSSQRWILGEDATAFGGALRDMWNPTCAGDPGKVSDSEYHCFAWDNGGVHTNSGVPNHAYSLLVDGGSYNGEVISGLGLTKSAHIFARANFYYLTATSDFAVLADALEAAATDLIGVNLESLSTTVTPGGPSGEVITSSDIIELQKVLLAVEMRLAPACGFDPLLAEDTLLCEMALPHLAIYHEDFETGLGEWTIANFPVDPDTWEDRDWEVSSNLPHGRPGWAAFGVDPINGDCNLDLESGLIRLESPLITIPASISGEIEMAFDHYVAMENRWDGGNIKFRLNSGSWTLLPSSAFTVNPYNNTLHAPGNNDNPLAGELAYTGTDDGTVAGSWARSVLSLSAIGATAESTLQFRFEVGTDGCNGRIGWYIDDISIYSCNACQEVVNVAEERISQEVLFHAGSSLSTSDTITNGSHIIYNSGDEVRFESGFEVTSGSTMEALIGGCEVPSQSPPSPHHQQVPTDGSSSSSVEANP